MESPYDAEAIRNVVNFLRSQLEQEARGEGCNCIVCGERAKWNRRSLSKKQVKALVNLYKKTQPGGYSHITEFAESRGDGDEIAKTRYWQLAAPGENTDKKKLHSGYWKLTDFGRQFVEGRVSIYKYVWVYRAHAMAYDGEGVSIYDCYGQHFDIREVLVAKVYR